MRTITLWSLIGAAIVAAAWGADIVWAPPLPDTAGTARAAPDADSTTEIYWDNGTIYTDFGWYTGANNSWGGNDYDISTLSTYTYIYSSRIYYYPNWPNSVWEGNGMACFAFSGGTPGSMMMPSRYVRGSGAVGGWQSYNVNWSLGSTRSFLFAYSQLYNYPNCDPVMPLDTSYNGGQHSWYYYDGAWIRMCDAIYGYYALTLMHRCTINDETAVEPSSLGRVKAMFH